MDDARIESRRPVLAAVAGSLVLLLTAGVSQLVLASASGASPASVALGAYAGAADPAGVASFASSTGAKVTYAEDYLPGSSGWAVMDGSGGELGGLLGPWQGKGYQMVFSVPIIPSDASGDALGTLAAGAAGDYDSYFTTLAQTLVSYGFSDAILRIGEEFYLSGYNWSVSTPAQAEDYAAFYQHIVTTMRAVSPNLEFIWEGASGPAESGQDWTAQEAWPGSSYVNYIGTDVYDQSWDSSCGLPFNDTATATEAQCVWEGTALPDLTTVTAFASSVGLPVVLPEWGLAIRGDGHGLGDDPVFVNNMALWLASHNVAFAIYFNYDQSGQEDAITDGNFPDSLVAFESALGEPDVGSQSKNDLLSPLAETPESPLAIGLPALGILILSGVVISKRRRRVSAAI